MFKIHIIGYFIPDEIGSALYNEFVTTWLLTVPGPIQGTSLWAPMKKMLQNQRNIMRINEQ